MARKHTVCPEHWTDDQCLAAMQANGHTEYTRGLPPRLKAKGYTEDVLMTSGSRGLAIDEATVHPELYEKAPATPQEVLDAEATLEAWGKASASVQAATMVDAMKAFVTLRRNGR